MVNDKLIDKASKKFKFVSRSKTKKFKYLPEWIKSEADYFHDEIIKPRPNHKVYRRGALVFVDFGINVGNELSGNHFAVVLSKKDSKNNGVLTVVPVSSKGNLFSVELDGLISEKSKTFLRQNLQEIGEELEITGQLLVKNLTTKDNQTDDLLEQQMVQLENQLTEFQKVVDNYSRFNKISYAKCLDIQTISKNRILQLNQFDPVGKIRVSDKTLSKIDSIIIKHFTNILVDKPNSK